MKDSSLKKRKIAISVEAITLIIGVISFAFIFSCLAGEVGIVSAQDVTYCCEKTKLGSYCQNVPREQCNEGVKNPATGEKYKAMPTSCESTSYCKKGCCYDSDEGVCMENTPEEACRVSNGAWSDNAACQIPQCSLGCCVLGTEAAYVTFQRCKKLSGFYSLSVDFRTNIQDEISCIALATSQELGACVYESDSINTCKFTTRGECNSATITEGRTNSTSVKFYKNYLCTAEELNTDCEKTKSTICQGDKVYFVDTCKNPANIYDSRKINDETYWTKIVAPEDSCNGDAKFCGNCDYLGKGTICKQGKGATYGDYICNDVNCYKTSNGKDYKNGESWCYYDNKIPTTASAGSRHYRHICFMGEEMIEPCADLRNEICVENSIGEKEDFSQAGCVVNRWQDCPLQETFGDCVNKDKRDCMWIPFNEKTMQGILDKGINPEVSKALVLKELLNIKTDKIDPLGKCVPKIGPGLEFWSEGANNVCQAGTAGCVVKYTKKLYSDWKCKENCQCIEPATAAIAGVACSALGDCGPGINYIGKYVNEGFEIEITENGKENPVSETKAASPSSNFEFSGAQQATQTTGQETFPRGQQEIEQSSKPASPTGSVIQSLIAKATGKD